MTQIVAAGLPLEVVAHLQRRFGQVTIKAVRTGNEALELLDEEAVPLLILDDDIESPSATEVLEQIQRRPSPSKPVVVYCLGGAKPDLPGTLVKDLGVCQVLFHPVDPDELSVVASSILGVPLVPGLGVRDPRLGSLDSASGLRDSGALASLAEARDLKPEGRDEILAGLASAWSRLAPVVGERLDVLEQAGVALLEGKLSPELRQHSECEAHKLAGLLGTVGFPVGSRFALEMERILRRGTRQSESYGLRFSELVVALRLELEKTPVAQVFPTRRDGAPFGPAASQGSASGAERVPSLLIGVPEADLAERLAVEAISRGMRVETAGGPDAFRTIVAIEVPDVVLLDLGIFDEPEQGLKLLAELSARTPSVPVLVLTARSGLTDRVEVARHGSRGFLSKSLAAGQILEAVEELWQRLRDQETKVMAVDDDPLTLQALRALLEPRGIGLTTLDDPLRFWELFEHCSPDLLLLDIEMPHLSGIELCRVVRNDAIRAAVPVIFLTIHTDAETVHRVFAAGADDFVSKPIVGPELLTRIFNRLERSRLHRSMAEIDVLTGVPNRRKSAATLDQFLRLAERYGQPLSLAVLTLDRFREINARYGHAAADEALRQVGQLLRHAFRSEDIVGRWGGAEFVIGMCGLSRHEGVQRLAEVLEALRPQRFSSAAGTEFRMSFSAGVAEYPEDGADLQALYRAAQETARQATAAGVDRVLPVGWSAREQQNLRRVDVALVMGDEAEASLLLDSFKRRGYRSRWLRDGNQAAKVLSGPAPRLKARVVVLDADVPGLDGLELLGRLAQGEGGPNRVIMVTAPSVGDGAAAALKLGAFDYVAKPFDVPVLVRHVGRALDVSEREEHGVSARKPLA